MSDMGGKPGGDRAGKPGNTDDAFDHWLTKGLHQIFDDVMNEPIPPELLKLLQGETKK